MPTSAKTHTQDMRERGQHQTNSRMKKPDPFYLSNRWRRLRAMVLSRNPLCADPFMVHGVSPCLATEVDHIAPRSKWPGLELVMSNLQPLCKSCHSRKTIEEKGNPNAQASIK